MFSLDTESSSVINADTVELVVATLTKDEEDADRERLQVGKGLVIFHWCNSSTVYFGWNQRLFVAPPQQLYSAFKTPKIAFNTVSKSYQM